MKKNRTYYRLHRLTERLVNRMKSGFGKDRGQRLLSLLAAAALMVTSVTWNGTSYNSSDGVPVAKAAQITGTKVDKLTADTANAGGVNMKQRFTNLFDGKYESKWCVNWAKPEASLYVDFHTDEAVNVIGYSLTTAYDTETYPERNPSSWILSARASKDDEWTKIAVVDDHMLATANKASEEFRVDKSGRYKLFRFEITKNVSGGGMMQLGEFELYDGAVVSIDGGSGGNKTKESHESLLDDNNDTVWKADKSKMSRPEGESDSCWWIDFSYGTPVKVNSYTLNPGTGSNLGSNPRSWILKGKSTSDGKWKVIDSVSGDLTMESGEVTDYSYAPLSPGTYKFFRLMVKDNWGGEYLQLARLCLSDTKSKTTKKLGKEISDDMPDTLPDTIGGEDIASDVTIDRGSDGCKALLDGKNDNTWRIKKNKQTKPEEGEDSYWWSGFPFGES